MPEIEYVVVADHAEAFNGKLYLHGAGWTDVQQPIGPGGQPGIVHIGMAVSILVGWNETNRRFPLRLAIVHEDGGELVKVDAQIEAGRPPGTTPGSDLRNMLAIGAELQFPKPGSYELRAEIAGKKRSVSFRVHHAAAPTGPGPATVPQLPPAQS
jgi:hypothetical protein